MRSTIMALTAVAALGFSVSQVSAATLIVDSFDTNQSVGDPNGVSTSSVVGGMIGGTRTLDVVNTAGSADNATTLDVAASQLFFSNKAGAEGIGTLFYNGGGFGLGSLLAGSNTVSKSFINFAVAFFDNDSNVDITVNGIDGNGGTISYFENVKGTGFSPNLRFKDFAGFMNFDFTDVASLEFIVSTDGLGPNIDGAINAISISAVPLPASSLLLLGGLGGLMAMRRRKNKVA